MKNELFLIDAGIDDENEFNICKQEFAEKVSLEILNELKPYLDNIHTFNKQFPFYVFDLISNVLPRFFGKNGTKYFLYLMDTGAYQEIDWDETLQNEILATINAHHIAFGCAKKYLSNPHDYLTTQMIYTEGNEKTFIRLIRSDQTQFDFFLDVNGLQSLITDLLAKLNQIMEKSNSIPSSEYRLEFLHEAVKYTNNIGLSEENEDGTSDGTSGD